MTSQHPFSSIENKRMIWSSLVESSYFKGFPASQKDTVKRVLDSVVHEVSQLPAFASMSVAEKNREVAKQMMSYRDLWVQDGTVGSSSHQGETRHRGQGVGVQPGYVSQVTAEEIREQREQAFNQSLRAKQEEMEGYLSGSRPQNIDFSDNTQEQRIGGDMERLVAEAEAERRRQMETLFSDGAGGNVDAEKWVNGGRPLKIDNSETLPIESQAIPSPRRVRFSDDVQKRGAPDTPGQRHRTSDNDVFAKLKRRPASPPSREQYETLMAEMKEMRSQIAKIGKDIERLLDMSSSK